jgi:hypothetical protein
MHDAQDGVDGVGICGLVNSSASGGWVPFSAEIAALEQPSAGTEYDAYLCFRIGQAQRREFDIKIEVRMRFSAFYEARVASFEHLAKTFVTGVHPYGHAADGNHHAAKIEPCG